MCKPDATSSVHLAASVQRRVHGEFRILRVSPSSQADGPAFRGRSLGCIQQPARLGGLPAVTFSLVSTVGNCPKLAAEGPELPSQVQLEVASESGPGPRPRPLPGLLAAGAFDGQAQRGRGPPAGRRA